MPSKVFQHQYDSSKSIVLERMRTAYNGGVEGSYISLPFGDGFSTLAGTDADANHYGTLDHDAETATDHAEFRQYSEAQGRWLSPDPYDGSYDASNPQSFNRYVYAGNNPLAATDPSGLCTNLFHDVIYVDGSSNLCPPVQEINEGAGGGGGMTETSLEQKDTILYDEDGSVTYISSYTDATFAYNPNPNIWPSGWVLIADSSGPATANGGGGGGAPNNFITQTLQLLPKAISCHASAFKKEGIALTTDVIGAIPGEGSALRIGQLVAGGVGFVNGLVQSNAAAAVGNVLTGQATLVGWGAKSIGATALEAVPVIGNFVSAGFAVRDLINEAQDAYACMGGN